MKKIISFFIFILFIIPIKINAISCINGDYEAIVNITKETLNLKEEAIINVKSDYKLDIFYQIKNDEIIQILPNGIVKPLKEGKAEIIVNINFLEEEKKVEDCKVNIPITITDNEQIFLKSLTIDAYDMKELFKSDIYNYEIKLPYDKEFINITATANDDKATILGTGPKNLKIGLNEYKIIVKKNDFQKTYTLSIFREEANKDTFLKNLIIDGYLLNPKFDKNIYHYELDVGKDVNKINIKATANNKNSTIEGLGEFELATGKNIFSVIVQAENHDKATYQIEVNKLKGNSNLKDLIIDGYNLDSPFQSDKYIYYLEVSDKVEKLKIKPVAFEDDKVEILNNNNLNYGQNDILIRVISKDKTNTTYKLVVNRLEKEQNNNLLMTILLIIFIISVVIMITLIIILIKRNHVIVKRIKKGSE